VLHAARMSPYRLAGTLSDEEVATLHAALLGVLRDALARTRGLGAGQPCPVCGDTVREVSFADSALQYCPTCQTGGKPLADRRLSRLLK
jgi:formamidopyrimidine-DNA glycosylase